LKQSEQNGAGGPEDGTPESARESRREVLVSSARDYLALVVKTWLPPGLVVLAIVSGLLDLDVFLPVGVVFLVVFAATLVHYAWQKSMGWRVDSRQLERQVAKTRMAIERATRLQNELDQAERRIEELPSQLLTERDAGRNEGVAAAYGGIAALSALPLLVSLGRVRSGVLVLTARTDGTTPAIGSRYSAILGDAEDGDDKGVLEVVSVHQGKRVTLHCVDAGVPEYWDQIKRLVVTDPSAANNLLLMAAVPELKEPKTHLAGHIREIVQRAVARGAEPEGPLKRTASPSNERTSAEVFGKLD
jgi:hypothetical protein